MTQTPKLTKAQLDTLDRIAQRGYYVSRDRRSAEVLKRHGLIEQRPAPKGHDWPAYMADPWWITDAGSDIREQYNR